MPEVNAASVNPANQGQASNYADPDRKLPINVKLNLENLVKVDENI